MILCRKPVARIKQSYWSFGGRSRRRRNLGTHTRHHMITILSNREQASKVKAPQFLFDQVHICWASTGANPRGACKEPEVKLEERLDLSITALLV